MLYKLTCLKDRKRGFMTIEQMMKNLHDMAKNTAIDKPTPPKQKKAS